MSWQNLVRTAGDQFTVDVSIVPSNYGVVFQSMVAPYDILSVNVPSNHPALSLTPPSISFIKPVGGGGGVTVTGNALHDDSGMTAFSDLPPNNSDTISVSPSSTDGLGVYVSLLSGPNPTGSQQVPVCPSNTVFSWTQLTWDGGAATHFRVRVTRASNGMIAEHGPITTNSYDVSNLESQFQ